jgi:Na+/melibiose symporter-like transporter
VLVAADLARAALLVTVPLAAHWRLLTLTQLVVVSLLSGAARVFFDLGYQSYLPTLLGPGQVLAGNAAMETARGSGQFVGPGLGGWLAGLAGAANVLGVQAVTFLASAVSLTAIRTAEPPAPRAPRHLLADVRHGLRLVAEDRVLRALAASSAVSNLAFAVASAVTVIFWTRDLRLTPAAIGAMVGAGALATVLGAALTPWLGRRLGPDRTVWLSLAATAPLTLLGPLASPGWPIVLAVAGGTAGELGQIVYAITSLSLRQRRCPPDALSRVNATMRFLIMGMLPLGALLGGALGDHLGPRLTLLASQALLIAAVVPAYRALRRS